MTKAEKIADLKKYTAKMKAEREEKAAKFEKFMQGYREWSETQAKRMCDSFWYDDWSGYSEPYDYTNF